MAGRDITRPPLLFFSFPYVFFCAVVGGIEQIQRTAGGAGLRVVYRISYDSMSSVLKIKEKRTGSQGRVISCDHSQFASSRSSGYGR